MKAFTEHKAFSSQRPAYGGQQWLFKFPNEYGASVVRNSLSYGHEHGLFELAVLNKKDEVDYSTPITEDVLGWLSEEEVLKTLDAIAQLPAETEATATN